MDLLHGLMLQIANGVSHSCFLAVFCCYCSCYLQTAEPCLLHKTFVNKQHKHCNLKKSTCTNARLQQKINTTKNDNVHRMESADRQKFECSRSKSCALQTAQYDRDCLRPWEILIFLMYTLKRNKKFPRIKIWKIKKLGSGTVNVWKMTSYMPEWGRVKKGAQQPPPLPLEQQLQLSSTVRGQNLEQHWYSWGQLNLKGLKLQ